MRRGAGARDCVAANATRAVAVRQDVIVIHGQATAGGGVEHSGAEEGVAVAVVAGDGVERRARVDACSDSKSVFGMEQGLLSLW